MRGSLAATLMVLAGTAAADPLEGVWRTAPDTNGHWSLIVVAPCGEAFCGTMIRAYDVAGNDLASPDLGEQVFWDAVPLGRGEYRGLARPPGDDEDQETRLVLTDDALTVWVCVEAVCREGSAWDRVR